MIEMPEEPLLAQVKQIEPREGDRWQTSERREPATEVRRRVGVERCRYCQRPTLDGESMRRLACDGGLDELQVLDSLRRRAHHRLRTPIAYSTQRSMLFLIVL